MSEPDDQIPDDEIPDDRIPDDRTGPGHGRIPSATYRLQLTPSFGFDAASAVLPYLARLGVSHVYCSPYLQAAPGSTHGYDVVDHSHVNDELGGEAAHARFCAALREHGLGQVVDVVPNHMAITPENAWWADVLENGPSSRFSGYFDVDWNPPERKLRNTVLMPILGDHYGRVLEAGAVTLDRAEGALFVRYADQLLPLAPPTYDAVLGPAAALVDDDELAYLGRAFHHLPPATTTDLDALSVRHRDKEILKRALGRLLDERPELATTVDRELRRLAADADRLDALLERQNYRLAYWRTAGQELDYRRFFDITGLAGLRMEDPAVFTDTHQLVLEWVGSGDVDGLRVDHPDGLADPAGYLLHLRAQAPDAWIGVEKILEPGEQLPADWPVDGTTGYDFLNELLAVFVDQEGRSGLDDAYTTFLGEEAPWAEVVHRSKLVVLEGTLAADVRRLASLFVAVCEGERRFRDFTRSELEAALVEAAACFDVYRTYVVPGEPVRPADDAAIARALLEVGTRRPDLDPELIGLLGEVLRGRIAGPGRELCRRFQQLSSPVMAKGVEDTAFYRFSRLLALNEVGGDPDRIGGSPDAFHEWVLAAADRWPASMLAGSTHDTKRSEDVRARLALLAEIPSELGAATLRWREMNARFGLDDPDLEYGLYQTFIGAHPLPAERAVAYALKAAREAKGRTSWNRPDAGFEKGLQGFVEGVLADPAFLAELDAFVAPLVEPGRTNSLAMQLVRLLAPGVPDIYQGTELWDLSLVDPDNRRPVDFDLRSRRLAELEDDSPGALAGAVEGLAKLLVTRRALAVRRRGLGPYQPVPGADTHVLAFTRGRSVAVVVPRLPLVLARNGGWGDRRLVLPGGRWHHELSGGTVEGGEVSLAELFADFPVALLTAAPTP